MINKFISFFTFGKFYFKNKKNNKKVLIFDPAISSVLSHYIDQNNFYYFYSRKEKFEISVFFSTIFQTGFKNFSRNYFLNFVKKFRPKFILSMWILNDCISLIKKKFPEIKLIIIQSHRIFNNLLNKIEHYPPDCFDYIFAFRDFDKQNLIKTFHKSKIFVTGSIKYNHFNCPKLEKSNKILYYSEYKLLGIAAEEKMTLKLLNKFCITNKLKFDIQLRNKKISTKYSSFLKLNNYEALDKTLLRKNQGSSYVNSNYYKFIVSHSSTLVDEFLSNYGNRRIAVIDSLENFDKEKYSKVNNYKNYCGHSSNPMFKETKPNFFWTKNINESNVNKVLNNLIYSSDEEYKREINKYLSRIIYDKKNSILKENLNKIGVPIFLDEHEKKNFKST